jgi:hypothetical protein
MSIAARIVESHCTFSRFAELAGKVLILKEDPEVLNAKQTAIAETRSTITPE